MTDKEVKRLLRQAYQTTDTAEKRDFVRRYARRDLSVRDLLLVQARYLRVRSVLLGVLGYALLLTLAVLGSLRTKTDCLWMVSALMPLLALMTVAAVGRSERYHMNELEQSTRFSLRLVLLSRLLLAGGASLLLFLPAVPVLRVLFGVGILRSVVLLGCPYMLTAWCCMVLIRRWHSQDNLYACAAIAAVVAVLPLALQILDDSLRSGGGTLRFGVLLCALTALTLRESIRYVRESEEFVWN